MMIRIRNVVLLITMAGVATAQTAINETRPVAPDAVVEISNVKGSINVTAWDRPSVEVTGTLGKGSERLDISGSEKRQSIKVVLPSKTKNVKDTTLNVRVPKGASVSASGVSAGISVDSVQGDLELQTVSGVIEVSGAAGHVEARTVSGGIDVEGRSGNVEAKAVSGSITIHAALGRAEASTVSGDIAIEGERIERLECSTVSGSIQCTGGVAANGDIELKAHSGSIRLALPATTEAEFDLSSFSGDIDSALGNAVVSRPKYGPGSSLEFSTGSASARIRARVFSGSITVSAR